MARPADRWGGAPPLIELPHRRLSETDAIARELRELRSSLEDRFAQIDDHLNRLVSAVDPAPRRPIAVCAAPADAPARVAVHCLGTFALSVDGDRTDALRSSKALTLFQYLVTRRQQLVPRDTLIQALWGEGALPNSGTSLKVVVHALRQALAQAVGSAGVSVVTAGSAYRLEADGLWVDVEEFERCYALGRAREADGDHASARACFEAAATLYRGDFLDDVADDWVVYRREALRDQQLYVLGRLAHSAVAAGDFQGSIVRCQEILGYDPCHEDTYRLMMLCHSRLGQRSRVRSWYELCVRRLRAELDCDPEPETVQLYRQAVAGRA
jgi:DNA-binding SARP family transcriptional activator